MNTALRTAHEREHAFRLGLCVFALDFTEFVSIGLVFTISAHLHASVAQVGTAVTAYALTPMLIARFANGGHHAVAQHQNARCSFTDTGRRTGLALLARTIHRTLAIYHWSLKRRR
ncbi:hypothetical protein L0Y47_19160 [Ectopseudomonas composti]